MLCSQIPLSALLGVHSMAQCGTRRVRRAFSLLPGKVEQTLFSRLFVSPTANHLHTARLRDCQGKPTPLGTRASSVLPCTEVADSPGCEIPNCLLFALPELHAKL